MGAKWHASWAQRVPACKKVEDHRCSVSSFLLPRSWLRRASESRFAYAAPAKTVAIATCVSAKGYSATQSQGTPAPLADPVCGLGHPRSFARPLKLRKGQVWLRWYTRVFCAEKFTFARNQTCPDRSSNGTGGCVGRKRRRGPFDSPSVRRLGGCTGLVRCRPGFVRLRDFG